MWSSATTDEPLLSLEGVTGFIGFGLQEGSRPSGYWQQTAPTLLCRIHPVPHNVNVLSQSAASWRVVSRTWQRDPQELPPCKEHGVP